MKANILKLHEAIAVVLLSRPGRVETYEKIAKEVNRRKLYLRKDGKELPVYQVMMRTKLSGQSYSALFKSVGKNAVALRS